MTKRKVPTGEVGTLYFTTDPGEFGYDSQEAALENSEISGQIWAYTFKFVKTIIFKKELF